MEDLSTVFSTPDATTDEYDKTTDSHDAPAGADGDGDAPMVSGAHLPEEGGTTMKFTEDTPESSTDDDKMKPDPSADPPSSAIVDERIEKLNLALQARRVSAEPAVFDSVVVIVDCLTRFTMAPDPVDIADEIEDLTGLPFGLARKLQIG